MGELLARTTSAEIVEQKAYEQLEPYGSLHLESVIGRLCALLHNINRKPNSEPLAAHDFMPALRHAMGKDVEAEDVLLDDDEAQSALIMAKLFGITTNHG